MKYISNDHKSLVCRRCQIVSLLLFTMGLGIITEQKLKVCNIHIIHVLRYIVCIVLRFNLLYTTNFVLND